MSLAALNFKAHLDSKELLYDYYEATEERNETISITLPGENAKNIVLLFFFDEDGESVNIKSFSIAKVPTDKLMEVYVALNELNAEYRWVKFYLDSDNEVTVSSDAIISAESAANECEEILIRFYRIIDKVYPNIMKAVWA